MKPYVVIIALLFSTCLRAQWIDIGPFATTNNTSSGLFLPEQVDRIAVDPNNSAYWFACSYGGVWMSNNSGATWAALDPDNHMYYGGSSAMAVDPSTSNVYIASSLTPRRLTQSIYYVTNPFGVQSWTALTALPATCFVHNIQFNPNNNNYLYACTTAGLFVSTNKGSTWTTASTTETYNIIFFTDGSTNYCVATGNSIFLVSTNATTFTNNATVSNAITDGGTWTATLSNICAGDVTGTTKYMYIHEIVSNGTSFSHQIYQVKESSGSFACTGNSMSGCSYSTGNPATTPYYSSFETGQYDDRLALGYVQSGSNGNGLLVFGAVYTYAIDTKNNVCVYPSVYHSDNHSIVCVPSSSLILLGTDGGFLTCNYSSYVYTYPYITFSLSSIGMDICQINGFSYSNDANNIFILGDQDALNGWEYNATSNISQSTHGSTEPTGGIINRNNPNEMIMNSSSYSDAYGTTQNGEAATPAWDYTSPAGSCSGYGIPAYNDLSGPIFEANVTALEVTCDQTLWGKNPFYQDPSSSRPDKMYYATSNLDQWDPINNVFAVKLRPGVVLSTGSSGSSGFIDWQCVISSIAISPFDHNAMYMTTCNRDFPASSEQCFPHLIKFIGSEVDACWEGVNEDASHWELLTPAFATVYPSYNYGTGDTAYDQIYLNSVVVSNLNSNKVWVGGSALNFPAIKVMQDDYDNITHVDTWTDYSTGIPSGEFVQCMEMEIGSNDGIYLGTDRAVYYRNATMSSWQLYNTGNDMPSVPIDQLQINYYENDLLAGTYGRGIWGSALNCPSNTTLTLSNTSNNEFDEATQYITSTAHITAYSTLSDGSESQVIYRGGTYVALQPGFKADPSSNFDAFIHPCTTSTSGNPNSPHKQIVGDGQDDGKTSAVADAVKRLNNPIVVYPNPNNGHFTVVFPENQTSDIHVYNQLGNEVYTLSQLTNQVQVDLSTQPSGIYFYRVTNESGGLIGSGKLVIEK